MRLEAAGVDSPNQPLWDNAERLAALDRYRILDTAPEPEFDDIANLAAMVCEAPVAVVNLIGEARQWFKAEVGLGVRETPLDVSICAHAILQPGLFVVPDTTKDPRFNCNPLVTGEPHLRFYAGALLLTPEGLPLGTLCVLDYKPREITERQAFALKTLARQVMTQLELRRSLALRDEALADRGKAEERQKFLIRELHHRVKNTLATVQAIMSSTARASTTIAEFQQAFAGRVASLAKTHSLLTEDQWQAIPFRELLQAELAPYDDGSQKRIVLEGPRVILASDLAVPIGMAVHELTTNAAKYGALAEFGGRVEVTWKVEGSDGPQKLHWEWNEHNGPSVAPPTRQGFGSRLLNRVLTAQIHADVSIKYEPDGLRAVVTLPLPSD